MDLEKLRYPTGKFNFPDQLTPTDRLGNIASIEEFPSLIYGVLTDLTAEQRQWKYRPDGWTIQQVVHHCADSHMNAMTRFKWALTEDNPTIKAYNEGAWAELADTTKTDMGVSLDLIDSLHKRWSILLNNLEDKDWEKTFYHPGMNRTIRLDQNLALYGWHCRHHLAHVEQAIKHEGVFEK